MTRVVVAALTLLELVAGCRVDVAMVDVRVDDLEQQLHNGGYECVTSVLYRRQLPQTAMYFTVSREKMANEADEDGAEWMLDGYQCEGGSEVAGVCQQIVHRRLIAKSMRRHYNEEPVRVFMDPERALEHRGLQIDAPVQPTPPTFTDGTPVYYGCGYAVNNQWCCTQYNAAAGAPACWSLSTCTEEYQLWSGQNQICCGALSGCVLTYEPAMATPAPSTQAPTPVPTDAPTPEPMTVAPTPEPVTVAPTPEPATPTPTSIPSPVWTITTDTPPPISWPPFVISFPSLTTLAPTTLAPATPAPTTPEPSTPAPTTPAPTTPAPTTPAPTTPAPTTPAPATPAPTTSAPTTPEPITPAPVTAAPVTPAPVTPAPVTPAPVTVAPVTAAPVTPAPVTPASMTPEPSTPAPTSEATTPLPTAVLAAEPPTTPAPTVQAPPTAPPTLAPLPTDPPTPTPEPATDAPTQPPVTSAPTEAPVTPQPSVPTPAPEPTATPTIPVVTLAPTTDAPTTTPAPTAAEPTPAPVTSAPITSAPNPTNAPTTSAPVTDAPITPVSEPTSAPVTSAPVTSAPATSSPVTSAPVTSAPTTTPKPSSVPITTMFTTVPATRSPTAAPASSVPMVPLVPATTTSAPPVMATPTATPPSSSVPAVPIVPITTSPPMTAAPTATPQASTVPVVPIVTQTASPALDTVAPVPATAVPISSTVSPSTMPTETPVTSTPTSTMSPEPTATASTPQPTPSSAPLTPAPTDAQVTTAPEPPASSSPPPSTPSTPVSTAPSSMTSAPATEAPATDPPIVVVTNGPATTPSPTSTPAVTPMTMNPSSTPPSETTAPSTVLTDAPSSLSPTTIEPTATSSAPVSTGTSTPTSAPTSAVPSTDTPTPTSAGSTTPVSATPVTAAPTSTTTAPGSTSPETAAPSTPPTATTSPASNSPSPTVPPVTVPISDQPSTTSAPKPTVSPSSPPVTTVASEQPSGHPTQSPTAAAILSPDPAPKTSTTATPTSTPVINSAAPGTVGPLDSSTTASPEDRAMSSPPKMSAPAVRGTTPELPSKALDVPAAKKDAISRQFASDPNASTPSPLTSRGTETWAPQPSDEGDDDEATAVFHQTLVDYTSATSNVRDTLAASANLLVASAVTANVVSIAITAVTSGAVTVSGAVTGGIAGIAATQGLLVPGIGGAAAGTLGHIAMPAADAGALFMMLNYLQFIASASHISLPGAPDFFHQFTDSLGWSVLQPSSSNAATEKTGVNSTSAGNFTAADGDIIAGVLAYAQRINVKPEELFTKTIIAFASVVGVVASVVAILYTLVRCIAKKRLELVIQRLKDLPRAKLLMRLLTQSCLSICLMSEYALSMTSSFQMRYFQQNQRGYGAFASATAALILVCFGLIVLGVVKLWRKTALQLADPDFKFAWGAYYKYYHFENRYFFVPKMGAEILSGVIIGLVSDVPSQLTLLMGLQLAMFLFTVESSPYSMTFQTVCSSTAFIMKMVTYALISSFLTSSTEASVRDFVGTLVIVLQVTLLLLFNSRQLYILYKQMRYLIAMRRARIQLDKHSDGRASRQFVMESDEPSEQRHTRLRTSSFGDHQTAFTPKYDGTPGAFGLLQSKRHATAATPPLPRPLPVSAA